MSNNLLSAAAGYYASLDTTSTYVEDVFSTYLYDGNGSSQTIANGIELSGQRDFSSALWASDAYVTSPNTNIDNFGTGPFTVELWLYHNSSNPDGAYATFFDNGSQRVFLSYGSSTNNLLFYSSSGQTNSTGFAHGMVNNTWNHVAFVRDGNEGRIFVNGTRIGTATITNNYDLSGTGTAYINAYSGSVTGYNTNSQWSDFRVVKGYALYDADFDPPTEPLQVIEGTTLLMFQGGSGATTDHSGTRTLTLTGSVTTSTAKPVSGFTPEAGKGGLVWIKNRTSGSNHVLLDTERLTSGQMDTGLRSNTTDTGASGWSVNPTSTGFGLDVGYGDINSTNNDYVSWTFRKAPRFFDVVTYTGDGTSSRAINHNLGSTPGCVIVKCTSSAQEWPVYHRGLSTSPSQHVVFLHLTQQEYTVASRVYGAVNSVAGDTFTVVSGATDNRNVNKLNETYVAYLFAHNDGDGRFGENNDQDIIKCGSYEGSDHRNEEVVELGFEPQFVLLKNIDSAEDWKLCDIMRGMPYGSNSASLEPNKSTAEALDAAAPNPTATGFFFPTRQGPYNEAGSTFIYIAIRRGPMKTPESGTEVFATDITYSSTSPQYYSGFPVDFWLRRYNRYGTDYFIAMDRLRANGNLYLATTTTAAELLYSGTGLAQMDGADLNGTSSSYAYMFRRAPGFLDVVAYEGTGVAQDIPHNLGVAPEMMIVKARNRNEFWSVYHSGLNVNGDNAPETDVIFLNVTNAAVDQVGDWNDTAPTATQFTVGVDNRVNNSTGDYIAYLFATVPGVSKVGSYSGDGTDNRTIDCGFSNGARFVIIKPSSGASGDWQVLDTERGFNAGNDPVLKLNTTAAEETVADVIDSNASGFNVNDDGGAGRSTNSGGVDYIFLAIA